MTTDPLDPLRVIKDRLAEAAEPIGLTLRQFVVTVANEGDPSPDHVQAVFTIDEDVIGKTTEQVQFDAAFEELASKFDAQNRDDKEAETAENLRKLLKHNAPREDEP